MNANSPATAQALHFAPESNELLRRRVGDMCFSSSSHRNKEQTPKLKSLNLYSAHGTQWCDVGRPKSKFRLWLCYEKYETENKGGDAPLLLGATLIVPGLLDRLWASRFHQN